jgi:hypothetical protein
MGFLSVMAFGCEPGPQAGTDKRICGRVLPDGRLTLPYGIREGLPVTRPQSKSIQETLRKAGPENVFDFRNLFQEPQIFREF